MYRRRVETAPLRVALVWLVGTYAFFLIIGQSRQVGNLWQLSLFIAATVAAFTFGYWVKVKMTPRSRHADVPPQRVAGGRVNRWVLVSGTYCVVYGLAFLSLYGAAGPGAIVNSLLHPGSAYFFRLRDASIADTSAVVQVLTLTSALSTPLVPLMVIFWDRLAFGTKAVAVLGVALYTAYWVYIGTQKGLGDFVVFALIGLALRPLFRRPANPEARRAQIAAAGVALLFMGYIVFNQADRLASQNVTAGLKPNPVATALLGEQTGRGVTAALSYPTHGYLGLSYALQSPFQWTKGRGSSRALDGYVEQYLGAPSVYKQTYPVRTEARTGWPADMYWSTLYPWLASDLTWPGAVVFMGVLGWWFARLWLEILRTRRFLSLLIFCQLAIVLAYVPANNQVGVTRPGLITILTLCGLYLWAEANKALGNKLKSPTGEVRAELAGDKMVDNPRSRPVAHD